MNTKSFLKFFFAIAIISVIVPLGYFMSANRVKSASDNFVLTWSSDSYIPQNYEGRALPTHSSKISVVVLPIKKLSPDPETLYYRWLLDNRVFGANSGQGKSSFDFVATKWGGEAHDIELQILDADGNLAESYFISIPIVEPQILLVTPASNYTAKDSLAAQTNQEINLFAMPLFFSIKNISELNFEWSFDGSAIPNSDPKNLNRFVLKIPAGELSELLLHELKLYATKQQNELEVASNNLIIEIR